MLQITIYNATAKMGINIEAFTYSGRHIGFPVGDILSLNAVFCRGNIFRKSHKKTPLHLYRFQRYEHESGLGGNFTSPLDIGGLTHLPYSEAC